VVSFHGNVFARKFPESDFVELPTGNSALKVLSWHCQGDVTGHNKNAIIRHCLMTKSPQHTAGEFKKRRIISCSKIKKMDTVVVCNIHFLKIIFYFYYYTAAAAVFYYYFILWMMMNDDR
jgi:hypothetical protein